MKSQHNLVNIEIFFDSEKGFEVKKEIYPIIHSDKTEWIHLERGEDSINVNPRFINQIRIIHLSGLVTRFWCDEDKMDSLLADVPRILKERVVENIVRNTMERIQLEKLNSKIIDLNL